MLPLRDNVPTRGVPLVTWALILANVLVWILYQLPDLGGSVIQAAFFPCEPVGDCEDVGQPWPANLFTSMFMHASWAHLLGNMLFLWIFGNNVEDSMGPLRYLAFYLLAGVAATATQSVVTYWQGEPGDATIPNVGASGAIAGVLGAYLILLPHARVTMLILVFVRRVPAWLLLGAWFLFQLWAGSGSLEAPQEGGGVAFFAHIGGFVFGMLAVNVFAVRRPLTPSYW